MRIQIRDKHEELLIKQSKAAGMSPSAYIAKLIENTQTGGSKTNGKWKQ